MKIFGWMQNKLNGSSKKLNPISVHHPSRKETEKEEFSDWPHGLLAIGTFGNNAATEEDSNPKFVEDNLEEFTPEEVEKLQNSLLHKQDASICDSESDNKKLVYGDEPDCRSNSVVIGRGKGIYNVDNTINKRSLSFLLKKMFVCRGGFSPPPTLRDQLPESTMEKILRAILHKKIYPQNQSSTKKYLKNNDNSDYEDEDDNDDHYGSKWVKTDSEYIVLEI